MLVNRSETLGSMTESLLLFFSDFLAYLFHPCTLNAPMTTPKIRDSKNVKVIGMAIWISDSVFPEISI